MSGFNFGSPLATTNATPTGGIFGVPKTTSGPLIFGSPIASGQPTVTTAATVPTFGTPVASSAPALGSSNFSFGLTTTAAAAPPPTFAFGATGTLGGAATNVQTTATPMFNFNTTTPAGGTGAATGAGAAAINVPTLGLGFGAAPAAATTTPMVPTLGLGGGGGGGGTGGAFSFAKAATTTPATQPAFGLNTSLNQFPTTGGLFNKPLTTTSTAAATATPFVGLGGVDVSATQPKPGDAKLDHVKVKETLLPEEIAKTVNALKTFIKSQKTLSSDIGRTSSNKLSSISSKVQELHWSLLDISNSVEVNYNLIKSLRRDTYKSIQTLEMAQRTQDTPAGMQYENNAPFLYFQNLLMKYEVDLINFRKQIAMTERHMRSLMNPEIVSPEDMKCGLRQISESFVSLAGRLNEVHAKVETQKKQFLNLRKYRLRDSTDVFAKLEQKETNEDATMVKMGPSPFSTISTICNYSKFFTNADITGNSTIQLGK